MSQFIAPHPFDTQPDTRSRTDLRKHLRQQRRALPYEDQQQAAEQLALNLLTHADLHRARHIAIYLPNDGEIDPRLYMDLAERKGIRFYLPVLHPIHTGTLVFSPFTDISKLKPNRFGIPEPAFSKSQKRPAWALDAVFFPLVGFDENGGRLGMGGGFYDRTFAFTRVRPRLAPKLIGLAHDFQKVQDLPTETWDVPLHGVVTDRRCYRFQRLSTA